MMDFNKKEVVENGKNVADERKERRVDAIYSNLKQNKPKGTIYDFLATDSIYYGLYEFYFNNDVIGIKQWLYVSSLLRAESCKYSGGWDMWTPHAFIFPLLTDHQDVIQRYSTLTTVNDNDHHKSLSEAINYPKEGRFNVLRLQAVLRQNWERVNQMNELFLEKIKKPKNFELLEISFYKALQDKDKVAAKAVIQEYLNPKIHQYLNQHLTEEFNGEIWSHHPVMFTKLAWMNGLEIEIDHPLLPMELMPIRPLEHYDYHYDFLNPNWKPQSFWGKLFGQK